MLMSHKYEGKNEEELLQNALNELDKNIEEVYYNISSSESGLFKGKKVIVEILLKEEILKSIKEYISNISKLMNIEINSEVRLDQDLITITIISDNNSILIGKDGKTLTSLQLLIRQTFQELKKYHIKINVDVGNYKAKKMKNLEFEIKKICRDVRRTKVEAKLDPMNSFERRLVHSIVSEFECLQSISEGNEPNRYTIIKYKDN